ncbi:MAG: alpha/beta hydrolase [Cyclobacteriaceae bacterium]|nr:alpha/beta hydrolase [Cyclobacteriaceae bacterium]
MLSLAAILYFVVPLGVLSMVTNYPPYSFEKVLQSEKLRNDYGINQNSSPKDYGFYSDEISFISLDSTRLSAWWVPAKQPVAKSIVFVHGRTSNRLKTMKYLAMIDSLQLDSTYNVFIPDLRNSGKSQQTKTYMGYKFGEDLTASLQLLKERYHQDTVILYGFSMGAMAILNATGRSQLKSILRNEHIAVIKIVLDSPLANVKATLTDQAMDMPLADVLVDKVYELYGNEINGFEDSMKLSVLLDKHIPALIVQSRDDKLTKTYILRQELLLLQDYPLLDTAFFDGPDHVKLFQDERTQAAYIETVGSFLEAH